VNLGASGFYAIPGALVSGVDPTVPRVCVYTAAEGQTQEYTAQYKISLDEISSGLFDHIIPCFQHIILRTGIMCDKDCKVFFTKQRVTIYSKHSKPFLTG
jgi:hypothetical protein